MSFGNGWFYEFFDILVVKNVHKFTIGTNYYLFLTYTALLMVLKIACVE